MSMQLRCCAVLTDVAGVHLLSLVSGLLLALRMWKDEEIQRLRFVC